METTLITELIKIGAVTGLLAYIALTLWKRFDTRVKEMTAELQALKEDYHTELKVDRVELKLLVRENAEAMRDFKNTVKTITTNSQTIMSRCTTVMECLTKELRKVKPTIEEHNKKG